MIALLQQLTQFLPKDSVLLTDEAVRPYECDGLSAYRERPAAVVLPNTLDEVQQVLKFCYQHKIPVVARGAGTGLSGGALPHKAGVLLSLAKFKRILAIDPKSRTARVETGVRNLAISQAVAPFGLYYAPDPSSQVACTIGGNVAENSGGVHCLKYGLTVHNILEVKMFTMAGELLTIGSAAYDSAGYDLLALITGSEGLLGVVVEVTVRLLPKPEQAQVLMAAFDDVIKAGSAVAEIIAQGIIPAGLEMMDNAAIRAAEDFVKAGYPVEAATILLCELDGNAEEVEHQIGQVNQILRQAGATEIRQAVDEQQRLQFWAGRKAAFPAVGRISPDYYCMDGTIPRKHLATVLGRIAELSQQYGLVVANVFHAGDGNLHPLILFDANKAGQLEKAEALGGEILELCVAVGGTITGEHGVGMEKINQMCVQFNSLELTQFHALKKAFDPDGLLNPDKAIPTLHRCAEFGKLHVHHGELPFPELERF
ncbi:FAD-linked oxidase C-terminal domain-containing protein [Beggiatoa leptomitoformis]|uniref:FAD-binding protein n=1 Tax=Beggiatoa leptomitoformis TaxID=288004 RepID=A0A2N9YIT1_9GAMM|nr:FAD-linked oxidase C-terminal domain-containing protein [Beggiatoa leptomitoformis]ALG67381.1 FAD-binding protein [Beggiatoa leptomitoformis]AUI70410.1 FAD-binding protein [Beggiatoa leptomitoformis]